MSKDDPNSLGNLSKSEMALIVVGAVLVLIVGTYSAAVIIGMLNSGSGIVVTGTIDLGLFQGVVFSIAGAGILMLGITQGQKVAGIVSSSLRGGGNGEWARQNTAKALNANIAFYQEDIERSLKLKQRFKDMQVKYPSLKDNFDDEFAACDTDIEIAREQLKDAIANKEKVMNDSGWNN